jgi:glycosyltransferase involved in cell wall biosynthesis
MSRSDFSVSVVIPAYNCGRYLPAAIASVRAQACPALEIIVVDDGSTDDTPAVVERIGGVVYRRQPRGGAAAARNAGVRAAEGTFLAFLDADDCWCANKIARQMPHLVQFDKDMVFGHAREFTATDVADGRRLAPHTLRARCAGTMLIATDTFRRAGEFHTGWRVGEFIDWYLRAAELGLTEAVVDEVVLYRRLHQDNSGREAGAGRRDYLRIIKGALDRRRNAALSDQA